MLVRYRTGRIRAFKGSDQVSKAVEAARVVHPSTITHTRQTYGRVIPLGFSSTRHCLVKPGRKVPSRTANGWQVAKASRAEAQRLRQRTRGRLAGSPVPLVFLLRSSVPGE